MELTIVDEKFVPLSPDEPRSNDNRAHLTSIARYIRDKAGLGYRETGWDRDVTMEVGFMWEDVLTRVFKDRMAKIRHSFIIRPGEIELDGIVGTPDGLGPDPLGIQHLVLEEYKATWRSTNKSPADNWDYMVQTKGYCKMTGTTVVVMRILHIVGDYRGSGPQYRVARIEYTQDEIDQNWAMLQASKDKVVGDTVVEG